MPVGLEDSATRLLVDWSEWRRLHALFGVSVPERAVELDVLGHLPEPRQAAEDEVRWAVSGVWDDEPTPQRVVPSVGELVAEADRVLALIAEVDPATLPPGQALGEAQALSGLEHRIRHAQLGRTRDVAARSLYEHMGYRSLAAWQQTTAPDSVAKDRTLARRLGDSPHLAAALADRRVSFDAASRVAGCLAKLRPQLDRPDALIDGLPGEEVVTAVAWNVVDLVCRDRFGIEHDPTVDGEQAAFLTALQADVQQLLDEGGSQQTRVERAAMLLATHLPAKSLKHALEELELQLLPSVLEDREKTAQDKRALGLRPNSDGTWELTGILTPEVGEQLFTALAAEARRDPANPIDTQARAEAREAAARAHALADGTDTDRAVLDAALDLPEWEARALRERGDSPLDADAHELVPRSRSKRLHDALGRLLTRYLEGGLGGLSGKVPVQLAVTISARTIEGAPGAPPARGASGRPLARSLLQRWWFNSRVTVLLMSEGWIPLGVVHRGRTITGVEMTAARVQYDNRCPGIGCCSGEPDPLIPLIPHHVDLFSATGETSLTATLMPCPNLHNDIHVGKKVIRLRDGRFISEDGYLHDPD